MALMVYFGLMLYLAVFQRRVMYYPVRAREPELTAWAAKEELTPWRNADGVIIGWRPEPVAASGVPVDALLVFHGNAGFALDRIYFADGFSGTNGQPAFTVFLFEYPGYGARPGHPSESAFREAADEALHLLQQEDPGRRIFLAGESLGSGVAADLAGRHPEAVSGLFLATAFSSMADVAQHHYPYMPVRWLLRDRYDSAAALKNYHGPVAILLAGQDEVVPARFGFRLYETYDGPKKLWVQDNRRHNTLDYSRHQPWWQEAGAFLGGTHGDRRP